jgi:MbeD/MobD like
VSGIDRLHAAWQRAPAELRATFQANHEENVRLRARVRELEKQLQHERRLAHQLVGPRAKPRQAARALVF